MTDPNGGGGEIKFTIKEYLFRIEQKIDALAAEMHLKANIASLLALQTRIEAVERTDQDEKALRNAQEQLRKTRGRTQKALWAGATGGLLALIEIVRSIVR